MPAQVDVEVCGTFNERYYEAVYDESPGVKLVLLVVHNEEPIRTGAVVRETRLSTTSVQRSLRKLLEKNIISKRRSIQDPRSTLYEIK